MLMEMNVFEALGDVLGLFANIAIAWMMAVVADLVINKPLGLSPPGIEFKRAHLWDINPVGVGAMALASGLSVAAHLGVMGSLAQAWSAAIAMVTALITAPLIAWATKGRYYLARPAAEIARCPASMGADALHRCVICERDRKVAQEESNRQTQALMREIASHRRTDEALQSARLQAERAQASAEAANQAKSRYISTISHELRTPLNAILGYAQLMAADASLPPQRRQAVQVIKRGGEHLMQLIDGTLDIARIEAGRLSLEPTPVRFADLLHELADMFEPQATAKGLRFRFETAGALPEWVRADEQRLRQILINLLGNAIKFTAEGGVTLRVRPWPRDGDAGDRGHRPRHGPGRAGAHLRALRARRERPAARTAAARRPAPDSG
ncbi:his kinase A (phospho-acceptor) domain-containing protein [Ditylenchus destructor]|nr:his kinase A (phospho-acceptor) domain-containing protein [Ditylenchus destructor]